MPETTQAHRVTGTDEADKKIKKSRRTTQQLRIQPRIKVHKVSDVEEISNMTSEDARRSRQQTDKSEMSQERRMSSSEEAEEADNTTKQQRKSRQEVHLPRVQVHRITNAEKADDLTSAQLGTTTKTTTMEEVGEVKSMENTLLTEDGMERRLTTTGESEESTTECRDTADRQGLPDNSITCQGGTVLTEQVEAAHPDQEHKRCCCRVLDYPLIGFPRVISCLKLIRVTIYDKWLAHVILSWWGVWIVLCVVATVMSLYGHFVNPTAVISSEEAFQVFASSHPVEQYDLHYKNHFLFEQKRRRGKVWMVLVWGIKIADYGNYLNPEEKGTLGYDVSFEPHTKEGQKWFLDFCNSVKSQPFYLNGFADTCIMEELKNYCPAILADSSPSCCVAKDYFPYDKNVAKECLRNLTSRRRDFHEFMYDMKSGHLKGMTLAFETTTDQSLKFDLMDKMWTNMSLWAEQEFKKAPSGMENAWIAPYDVEFYVLQSALREEAYSTLAVAMVAAFATLLLTTGNFLISMYSVVTIAAIALISTGCLVVLHWELNMLFSFVLTISVGLSTDFTVHYAMAYRLAPDRSSSVIRVRHALEHAGPAVTMAMLITPVVGELRSCCNNNNNNNSNSNNNNNNNVNDP